MPRSTSTTTGTTQNTTLASGQVWARTSEYGEHEYLLITEIYGAVATVRDDRTQQTFEIGLTELTGLTFVGYDGPGQLPDYVPAGSFGCGSCPTAPTTLAYDTELWADGLVTITRDGKHVWGDDDTTMTVAGLETRALAEPGDWRISFEGGLSGQTYQRRENGSWALVRRNFGYA